MLYLQMTLHIQLCFMNSLLPQYIVCIPNGVKFHAKTVRLKQSVLYTYPVYIQYTPIQAAVFW